MVITIERSSIQDVSKLVEVQNASFKADYDLLGEEAWRLTVWTEKKMEEAISKYFGYKILLADSIIGHFIVKEWKDDEYYIWILCIIPEYQNMGIGTMAVEFIEKEFSHARILSVVTPKQKPRNCHFYEKSGFNKVFEKVISETRTDIGYVKEMR